MYGLTEAFRSSYLPPELLGSRPDSIGRAVPNTELLVIAADGRRCGPGEVGELVHSGPTVAAGYWRLPQGTAQVFRPHPFPLPGAVPDTVVYSGDYVRMDDEGFLYYVGRGDQLFKSRGFRTNPGEIEAALLASGLASEVVVHPIQADGTEPLIVAGVLPAGNLTDTTDLAREIDAYAQSELASHLRPHHYLILRDAPRTSSGKTDRLAIRALMTTEFGTP
jgi:acyl-CoA synthetase (AMP-forming)/AMP-acid ligase II